MTERVVLPIHGNDHCKGGPDEMPCLSALADQYTPIQPLPLQIRNQTNDLHQNIRWGFVVDSLYPLNGYVEPSIISDGQYIEWLVNLGPKRSLWTITYTTSIGPDYGKLDIRLASAPLDLTNFPNDALPIAGNQTLDTGNLTFALLNTIDCYNATLARANQWSQYPKFLITGDKDVSGTAFTNGTGIYTGLKMWDGGSGLHYIRIKVNGKNASSTGFRARLIECCLWRVDAGFLW